MDALILARMQFAANITFHILFPTISIALGWVLLFLRLRWLMSAPTPPGTAAAPEGAGCSWDGPANSRRATTRGSWPTASGPKCSR